MVMICQECGDRGFANAFIYCVECLSYAIHRYCLDIMPKTVHEFVPWVCEDCKPKVPNESTFTNHYSIRSPGKDYASSIHGEEIQSRKKLKKNRDPASLVDGPEIDSCQEVTIEQDFRRIPLDDSPLKVNLKKRKKRDSTCLVDGSEEGSGPKVITESDHELVPLSGSPMNLDSVKQKKIGNNASLLNGAEGFSRDEAIREPDRELVSLPDASLIVNLNERKKERDVFSLVDGAEEDSCQKQFTELDQECVSLAKLCLEAKLKKKKKRHPDSPMRVKLKKRKKEEHSALDVKENCSFPGAAAGPEHEGAPLVDSPSKVKVKVNLKWEKDMAHTEARASELKSQSIPSQQPNGVDRKHDLAEHAELAGCCSPLKRKSEITESDRSCSVSKIEGKRLQNSPNNPPHESCMRIEQKEDVACSAEEQKCQFDSSQQPLEADKKLNIAGHAKLVSSGGPSLQFDLDKKTKDNKHTVSKTEDKRHQSRFHRQPPSMNIKQNIDGDKHVNIEKESLMIKKGSKPGHAKLVSSDCPSLKFDLDKKTKDNKHTASKTEVKRHQSRFHQQPPMMHKKQDIDGVKHLNIEKERRMIEKRSEPGHAKLVSSGCPSLKFDLDKKTNDNKHIASKTEDRRHQSRFHQQPPIMHKKQDMDGDKHSNIEKEGQIIQKRSEPGHEVPQLAKFANNSQQDAQGHAQPVIDPIWTGSFDIVNKDYETLEGFVGHVSSKVCLKVFEEASLLPSLLCLEMLPKSDLWPKSFQEYEPSDENIALYFFPADSKHERIFDHLVEDMMNQELAMRAVVTNAELLIFASTELPRSFWRFQGKYFLWGVFKGKRADPSPPPNHPRVLPKGSDGSALCKIP